MSTTSRTPRLRTATRGARGRLAPWALLLGVAVLVIWRAGPGKVPSPQLWEAIAREWPLYPLQPIEAYVLREALGQALYRLLGWAGTGHFLALHLIALTVAALSLVVWVFRQLGRDRGVIALCLLLVAPVTTVLLEWIGMYDAFSMIAWVALVIALRGNRTAQLAAGALGGVQNFEQFVVSVVLLALLPELLRSQGMRLRLLPVAVGALAGRAALEVFLSAEGAVEGSRANFVADADMRHLLLTSFAIFAPVIVWSALGPLWGPLVRAGSERWGSWSRSLWWRIGAAGVIVLGMGLVTADHTRVMALVTFPVVTVVAVALARQESDVSTWLRRPETIPTLLVPALVVWGQELLPLGLDLSVWGL